MNSADPKEVDAIMKGFIIQNNLIKLNSPS